MKHWKQPIPTNLKEIFGEDHVSRLIYIELLLRARNENTSIDIGGRITLIKRGQAVCGEQELGAILNRNRKTIKKHLFLLNTLYNKVDITTTSKGRIITIQNYDEVISMDNTKDNTTDNRGTTEGQQIPTNKSDKNAEKKEIYKEKEQYPDVTLIRLKGEEINGS